jgi:hypothetical protein
MNFLRTSEGTDTFFFAIVFSLRIDYFIIIASSEKIVYRKIDAMIRI